MPAPQRSASPMTEEELLGIINNEEAQGLGSSSSGDQLNAERARALDLYHGRLLGNEVPGRSSIVTRETLDTVEWIVPQLFRVFASGDEVVRFDPVGPEDVAAAEQETEVVNWSVTQQNPWPTTFYTWSKDALLSKVSYCWAQWDTSEDTEEEFYRGLSDDQLAMIAQDDTIQVVAHDAYPDQQAAAMMMQRYQMMAQQAQMQGMEPPPPSQPPMLHDVRIKIVKRREQPTFHVLPPEQCIVSHRNKDVSLKNCEFFQYWDDVPITDLTKLGIDVPEDVNDEDVAANNYVQLARDRYQESTWQSSERTDDAMRLVRVRWTWVRADYDGDGIAELVHVVKIGNKLVTEPEQVSRIPIAAMSPVWMPHRHVGLSVADLVYDLQLLKTTLMRSLLDNIYITNNTRMAVSDQVNLDDLLTSRPGGVVRLKNGAMPGAGHIMPLQAPVLAAPAFQMLEMVEQMRETRTGTSRLNQGLQPDALTKTASGTQALLSAGQQKIELMARLMAEGVAELFSITHELLQKHSQKPLTLKVKGSWVTVDPREWKKRQNLTIAVGLGTGDKQVMMQSLMALLQVQREAIQIGIATPENIYNSCIELTKAMGFRSGDKFWTDPKQNPQQPQPNPEMMKVQAQAQADQAKMQLEAQKAQQEAAAEQQRLQLETQKTAAELQLEREKAAAQLQLEREKSMMSAENDMRKHEMSTQATLASKAVDTQAAQAKDSESSAQTAHLTRLLETAIQALGQRGGINVRRDKNGRIEGADPA